MRKSSIVEIVVGLCSVREEARARLLQSARVVSIHGDDELDVDPTVAEAERITTAEILADPSDVRVRVALPGKRIVCDDCGGDGMVLNDSMRFHAYTAEDVAEWSEDEREQYFRVGGCYDVVCQTCAGARVVDIIDLEAVPPDSWQRAALDAWHREVAEDEAFAREWAAERARGC